MFLNRIVFFLLYFSLFSLPVFALTSDKDQPIQIVADSATIDDLKGTATYQGNVVITQGTIQIEAESVILTYTKKQDLKKAEILGKPAHFKQRPEKSEEDVHAKAHRMEYRADENMLYLTEEAGLWQGKDSFVGEQITYDTVRGVIRADKGKSGRVMVTIQPRKKDSEK